MWKKLNMPYTFKSQQNLMTLQCGHNMTGKRPVISVFKEAGELVANAVEIITKAITLARGKDILVCNYNQDALALRTQLSEMNIHTKFLRCSSSSEYGQDRNIVGALDAKLMMVDSGFGIDGLEYSHVVILLDT
jgi:hypothetical protein